MEVEGGKGVISRRDASAEFDDDVRVKRTGNVLTATTHVITVVVGVGVLALAGAMAQLGWLAGITALIIFASISIYTYNLIAHCYQYPDPVSGKRNYTYMQAIEAYLGGNMHVFCGLIQYVKLAGVTVGYTIISSTSLVAVKKAICFHERGHGAYCKFSNNPYMIGFGLLQILLSQIPNFHKLTYLSTIACITSFDYALIGSGLSLAVLVSGKGVTTRLFGNKVGPELSEADKVWKVSSALGNVAFACSYVGVVYDIMDTLKSSPPEYKQMRKANVLGILTMTILFLLCGGLGYAAFGDHTPGNILTGSGFYEPFWLLALGNLCIVIWLIWRTIYVIVATIIAMAMPFFNEFLALLGAIGFWPLIVFFTFPIMSI